MQDMTAYQWATIVIAVLGFFGTWIIGSFKLGRAVEKIGSDTSAKIAEETSKIEGRLSELSEKFAEEQKTQDHNFGEVGAAMRQYIATVEKEMHAIEIWGRDNYVLKSEFVKATDSIRSDIKTMAADIKSDIRDLTNKVTGTKN